MPCIWKFRSLGKTGVPLEHTKKNLICQNGCLLTPKRHKCILWMLSNIFNASTETILWLSSSHLTALDCPDFAESGSNGIFFRRQLHNNFAVYWIFNALSRYKSFGCKRRYGKYCLFYTVQACKFVTARFCYRANWTRVRRHEDNRLNTDFSLLYNVFYLAYKTYFCWCEHSLSLYLILSCPFLYARLQTGRIMVWWCPSVRPSGSPSVRPSVTVFRTFLLHALTYWSEILCITLFLCT